MSSQTLAGGVVHAEHRDDRHRTACGSRAALHDLPLAVTCRKCLGDITYTIGARARRGPFHVGSWKLAIDPLSGV